MVTPLLLSFLAMQLGAAPPQGGGDQMVQQLQQLQRQVADLHQTVEQMRKIMLNDPNAVCSAEVRWQPGAVARTIDVQKPVPLSLFSTVSSPAEVCLNAEVRITANYYTDTGLFVCSGAVSTAQTGSTQNTLFEFQPLNLEYFVKWRDGPTWDRSSFHRLVCHDYEGVENHEPGARASMVKLFATVLPKRGGVATAELTLTLPTPNPATNRR